MSKNPRVMALRFRIWQFATARGWNVTSEEIADAIGNISPRHVGILLRSAGWSSRIPKRPSVPPAEYDAPFANHQRRLTGAIYREIVGQQLGSKREMVS